MNNLHHEYQMNLSCRDSMEAAAEEDDRNKRIGLMESDKPHKKRRM